MGRGAGGGGGLGPKETCPSVNFICSHSMDFAEGGEGDTHAKKKKGQFRPGGGGAA